MQELIFAHRLRPLLYQPDEGAQQAAGLLVAARSVRSGAEGSLNGSGMGVGDNVRGSPA
jgi:hypothetical protein